MNDLKFGIDELNQRKIVIHCEILTIFAYGKSPADEAYISLAEKVDEIKCIDYSIKVLTDLL
jgi:hypothetical protein